MTPAELAALSPAEERNEVILGLQRILDNPNTPAEAQLAAEESLLELAKEVTEWIRPTGFRLLVYIPYLYARTESGRVVTPKQAAADRAAATMHGYVLAMGPQAYRDQTRFGEPPEPWCQVGDRVVIRPYSGTRFKRSSGLMDYALINDDNVEAVITGESIKIERR